MSTVGAMGIWYVSSHERGKYCIAANKKRSFYMPEPAVPSQPTPAGGTPGKLPGIVGADPAALAQAKTDFYTAATDFETSLGKVKTAVENVNMTWYGNTNKQFNAYQTDWQTNMQGYNNSVKSVGDALGVVGVDYITVDTPSAAPAA